MLLDKLQKGAWRDSDGDDNDDVDDEEDEDADVKADVEADTDVDEVETRKLSLLTVDDDDGDDAVGTVDAGEWGLENNFFGSKSLRGGDVVLDAVEFALCGVRFFLACLFVLGMVLLVSNKSSWSMLRCGIHRCVPGSIPARKICRSTGGFRAFKYSRFFFSDGVIRIPALVLQRDIATKNPLYLICLR